MSKGRLEAFSDGVFAIAITLLILEIRVPDVDYAQLPGALRELLPRLFAYAISFGVIGIYWVGHHNTLHLIGRVDGFMIWLNLAYLLTVSFMPFPTALLGRYPLQPLPIVIYAANLMLANLTGLVLQLYMRAHPELSGTYVHRLQHKVYFMYAFVNLSYVLAVVLAFVAPVASYAIFVVVLLVVIAYYSVTPVPVNGDGPPSGERPGAI